MPELDVDFDIEAELKRFEAAERARLGLEAEGPEQWREAAAPAFTASQREKTTLLVCGLTVAHDRFIQAALRGLGYKVIALDAPDNAALQFGKEYGNRGQCNPTYFTVGNLVKYLHGLREGGLSTQEIVDRHVFVTAGACGPCRFGMYVTEYRKALRDAGFDGFRVLLFQQTGGLKQGTGEDAGLKMDPPFFIALLQAIILGDVLNALMYRIRPYEVEAGATDAAVSRCKARIAAALEARSGLPRAIWDSRRDLAAVRVDRTRVKPKVGIIGEFWAMTTEGDGNYKLQRFLEHEGAEVDIQLVTAWLFYNIWCVRHDTERRAGLRAEDQGRYGLAGIDVRKRLLTLAVAEKALLGWFQVLANALGLRDYHFADQDEIAAVSHAFYDNNLRGGEGHMEVGKLILNVAKAKVNMTLSVKPFGCMPSSSVSDGVQSLVTEMFPEGIYLAIETSGDGAVNVQSRVQMQLFKARQAAKREVDRALAATGLTMEAVQAYIARHADLAHAFHRSAHRAGCTAADLVYEVAARRRPALEKAQDAVLGAWQRLRAGGPHGPTPLAELARRAAQKAASAPRAAAEPAHDPEHGPEHPHGHGHAGGGEPAAPPPLPKAFKKLPMARV